jgi:DUF4097 and DUF4098 domain-containing protein YvlB
MAMNWRMLAAVLFVLACAYGIVSGLRYARSRVHAIAATVVDEIETSQQPAFQVAKGTRTLTGSTDKRLRIENSAGSVKVVPGGPGTTAEYVVSARGENEAEARRRAAAVEVQAVHIGGEGDRIRVNARGRMPAGVTVDVVVHSAPDRALAVKTVSASIDVTGIQGGVSAESVSGEIELDRCGGSAVARTVSGGIDVDGAAGSVNARSTSGRVTLAGLHSQDVTAKTVSGGIRVGLLGAFSGRLESASVSGSLDLALPEQADCQLDASSVSGIISGGPWGSDAGHRASLRLGLGQGSVRLHTTSGGIHLALSD